MMVALCMALPSAALTAIQENYAVNGQTEMPNDSKLDKKADKKAEKEAKKAEKKAKKEAEKKRKEAEKQKVKAIKEYQDSLGFVVSQEAIKDKHFVIVADRVKFRRSPTINVNSSTNFVLVQGDNATVQLAFERGLSGLNGLGGITVEGRVSNMKIDYDKKGNLTCSMVVNGTAISADITFSLPKNGSTCYATVSSNFYPTKITFYGSLFPYNSNRIIEGRKLF